jgi:transposase InsO family protein
MHVQQNKRKQDNEISAQLWHARLGHISKSRIQKLASSGAIEINRIDEMPTCEPCLKGKMAKLPFKGNPERAKQTLDLIHTDVCGPLRKSARGGYDYFITFTDDFSRYGYVFLLKHKSEAFERFKEFKMEVENQLGHTIKALRSDRGGEFLSNEFLNYLVEHGILSQWTPPATPQLNGVAERRNRTLMDMVRSMMSATDLPLSFWGHALLTATKILNMVPSKSVEKTPYELWFGKAPSYAFMRIWGSPAYVKKLVGDKLETKSTLCKFVGYPENSIGYEFYDPTRQTTFVSRNAHFLEKDFLVDKKENNVELDEVTEAEKAEEVDQADPSPQAVGEHEHESAPESTPILRRSER